MPPEERRMGEGTFDFFVRRVVRHITPGRLACVALLHHCPSPPQLGWWEVERRRARSGRARPPQNSPARSGPPDAL